MTITWQKIARRNVIPSSFFPPTTVRFHIATTLVMALRSLSSMKIHLYVRCDTSRPPLSGDVIFSGKVV